MDTLIAGAELHLLDDAPMNGGGKKYATAHITWDKNATQSKPQPLVDFTTLVKYFTGVGKGMAPHILWCPFTGRIAQFFHATSRSKSLEDPTPTNRRGSINFQIEALFFPWCTFDGKSYSKLVDTPCKNWEKIQKFTEQLGIPSKWPKGLPDGTSDRSTVVDSGWYGHSQWDGNHHTDPMSWPKFVTVGPTSSVTDHHVNVPVFPGRQYFVVGANNSHVVEVDKNLIRLGFTHHNDGNGYQAGPRYTTYTQKNVADFQRSDRRLSGDPDGLVGPLTWQLLFTKGR